ncbi:hypothetical protein [Paraburkholderia bannensis]|uniref:hypothetical protein n=1 Tax=Paraburkholderia bannensis TaxID=765414 RepID=UPI002AB6FBEF|nr:hypothetical protein [Paraburkholderia bannensis]
MLAVLHEYDVTCIDVLVFHRKAAVRPFPLTVEAILCKGKKAITFGASQTLKALTLPASAKPQVCWSA